MRAWEKRGPYRPTLGQLRKISGMYRRPLALFYLPAPPRSFQPMHDFRRLPGADPTESPALRLEIRRAWERRDIALELLADLDEEPAHVPIVVTLNDNVEETATRVRNWLGVSPDQQKAWGGVPHTALNEWRATLEAHGVLAQTTGVPINEMRGFSIAERPLPVAVANIRTEGWYEMRSGLLLFRAYLLKEDSPSARFRLLLPTIRVFGYRVICQ